MRTATLLRNVDGSPLEEGDSYCFVYDDGEHLLMSKEVASNLEQSGITCIGVGNSKEMIQLIFEEPNDNDDDSEVTEISYLEEPEVDGNRNAWTDASTKLLLNLYQEIKPLVGNTIKFKTHAKMWDHISKVLHERGYTFTPNQVCNRFKTLERAYKKMIDNNNQTGRGCKTIPFEKELEEILGRRVNIVPVAVISSEGLQQGGKRKRDDECSETVEEMKETGETDKENKTQNNEKEKKIPQKKIKVKDGKTALMLKELKEGVLNNTRQLEELIKEKKTDKCPSRGSKFTEEGANCAS